LVTENTLANARRDCCAQHVEKLIGMDASDER
jgi:hypothetical protein